MNFPKVPHPLSHPENTFPAISHSKERLSLFPDILFTTPGFPGLTVLGQGDEYENKHEDLHSFGSAGKSQGWQ